MFVCIEGLSNCLCFVHHIRYIIEYSFIQPANKFLNLIILISKEMKQDLLFSILHLHVSRYLFVYYRKSII